MERATGTFSSAVYLSEASGSFTRSHDTPYLTSGVASFTSDRQFEIIQRAKNGGWDGDNISGGGMGPDDLLNMDNFGGDMAGGIRHFENI